MLAGLLLFFAAIIAINVAFAVAAVRTFPGEDERRSYTQGLHYNDVLAERRAQTELGWRARSELARTSSGARLIVHLADRAGAPIDDAAINAVLRWAPNESGDRSLRFTPIGAGAYAADLGALSAGRWELRARAEGLSGAALDFEAELTWPTL
ncbi:type cbb3 cytochrome oxidase biogenesis protein CcoH [alpha proteobacterium U9-1i]|nr:type cbb3 cytochrome oxidase biogenesis protein CcoH [alpha proteobacterium U9-1i]